MYICDIQAIKELYCILQQLRVRLRAAERKLELTFGGNFNVKEIQRDKGKSQRSPHWGGETSAKPKHMNFLSHCKCQGLLGGEIIDFKHERLPICSFDY